MYTFTKKVLIALTYCHAKADSGYPIGFRVSAGFGFEMDFDRIGFRVGSGFQVRVLILGDQTLHPTRCHPHSSGN